MRTPGRKLLLRAGLGPLLVAVAACYDCHSNQTRRPLYSRVAPFSWLVARDVEQGREKLNFSTWKAAAATPATRPRRSSRAACRPAATCRSMRRPA